jgi:DNA gyrase subunit B
MAVMAEVPVYVDDVRMRAGMFVGDSRTGEGALNMVLELVANAGDQHLAGRCSTIDVDIAANGTITVEDDGPGIPVHGAGRLPAIHVLLTQRFERATVDGHFPHFHAGYGGAGLAAVNALSERFELVTIRDGIEARTIYARGALIEPLVTAPTRRPSGTRIRFRPDPQIMECPRVPRERLTSYLEDLSFLLPRLTLRWRIAGDDVAAGGLAARVAIEVPCAAAEVANHRGTFDTPEGPIDVDVALAWRESRWHANATPHIDSFVNFERTRLDGSHVEGLIDGAAAFLGRGRRAPHFSGLVGAVAVVLTDVKWGSPTRDRLESPHARAPVAEATQQALARWAAAYPDAAAALREHKRRR